LQPERNRGKSLLGAEKEVLLKESGWKLLEKMQAMGTVDRKDLE